MEKDKHRRMLIYWELKQFQVLITSNIFLSENSFSAIKEFVYCSCHWASVCAAKHPSYCRDINFFKSISYIFSYLLPNYFVPLWHIRPPTRQRVTTLSWWRVLCASMTLRATLAGDSSPGRATQARQVKGERPD